MIGHQVIERVAGLEGDAMACGLIVRGGGGVAAMQHRFRPAIEGEGVGDTVAIIGALQDAVAFVVLPF